MEDRVPQLGGPLQADTEEMAGAPFRAEGAVLAEGEGQPQRYPHEEGAAGTCLSDRTCVLTTTHSLCCLVLTRVPLTTTRPATPPSPLPPRL